MKLIISLFIILLLSSCGAEYVEHTSDNPFIIGRIYKYGDKIVYEKSDFDGGFINFFGGSYPSITFDRDLGYRIGNTLQFVTKN